MKPATHETLMVPTSTRIPKQAMRHRPSSHLTFSQVRPRVQSFPLVSLLETTPRGNSFPRHGASVRLPLGEGHPPKPTTSSACGFPGPADLSGLRALGFRSCPALARSEWARGGDISLKSTRTQTSSPPPPLPSLLLKKGDRQKCPSPSRQEHIALPRWKWTLRLALRLLPHLLTKGAEWKPCRLEDLSTPGKTVEGQLSWERIGQVGVSSFSGHAFHFGGFEGKPKGKGKSGTKKKGRTPTK